MTKLNLDLRFSGIDYELWAISHYNEVVQQQLQFLDDQTRLRATARLKADGIRTSDAEWEMEMHTVSTITEETLPRFFRGAVLISAVALFESAVKEVGEYIADQRRSRLKLRDLTGDSPRDQLTKYFDAVLAYPLNIDDQAWVQIEELSLVRNAFAHCNGRMDLLKPSARARIERMCGEGRGLDLQMDLLLVSEEYVGNALKVIRSVLESLVQRVRHDFPA